MTLTHDQTIRTPQGNTLLGSQIIISKGYHLAECHSMALGHVPFTEIRNLAQFGQLMRALGQVPGSHLFKCTDWSLIQVTSRTDYGMGAMEFKE